MATASRIISSDDLETAGLIQALTDWAHDQGIRALPHINFAQTQTGLYLPSAYTGIAFITNVGPSGSLWQSNGVSWAPVGGRCLLYRSMVAGSPLTGSTAASDLDTVSIMGRLMGPTGGLEIVTRWTTANSADDKTLQVKFGGTVFHSSVVTTQATATMRTRIDNRNAEGTQIGTNENIGGGSSTGAWSTGTVNTTSDQSLVLAGQLENAADSILRATYEIWLIRG